MNINIYNPFAIKLYAFSLQMLNDYDWTGMQLFDYIKSFIKSQDNESKRLLRKISNRGLLFYIGSWLYDEYLDTEYLYSSYRGSLKNDHLLWYLDDIVQFLDFHGASTRSKYLGELIALLEYADSIYAIDEEKYYHYVSKRRQKFVNAYKKVFEVYKNKYFLKFKDIYALDLANRLFHDRIMCEYISQLLVVIGFDGSDKVDQPPKSWVSRSKNIPEWAKRILLEREGYKCASCKERFNSKNGKTVDHVVPLSKGGCNDLVNLQLLCKSCNNKKDNKNIPVLNSIPPYFYEKYFR